MPKKEALEEYDMFSNFVRISKFKGEKKINIIVPNSRSIIIIYTST